MITQEHGKIIGEVRVAAIAPFWRYAVGPTAHHSPAIPYYRLDSAMEFFDKTKKLIPWAGVVLYKRCGWRTLKIVDEYTPVQDSAGHWVKPEENGDE